MMKHILIGTVHWNPKSYISSISYESRTVLSFTLSIQPFILWVL